MPSFRRLYSLAALCLLAAFPVAADDGAAAPTGGHYQTLSFSTAPNAPHTAFWHDGRQEYRSCAPDAFYIVVRGETGCWATDGRGLVPARSVSLDLAVKDRCSDRAGTRFECDGYGSLRWPRVIDASRDGPSVAVRFQWAAVADESELIDRRAAAFALPTERPLSEPLRAVSASLVPPETKTPFALTAAPLLSMVAVLFILIAIHFIPKARGWWGAAFGLPFVFSLLGYLALEGAVHYGWEGTAALIAPIIVPFSWAIAISGGVAALVGGSAVVVGLFKRLPELA